MNQLQRPAIVAVKPIDVYQLQVVYNDDVNVIIDMSDAIESCAPFRVLSDRRRFRSVRHTASSVTWPAYDIDLCADAIYDNHEMYMISQVKRWVEHHDESCMTTPLLVHVTRSQRDRLRDVAHACNTTQSAIVRQMLDDLVFDE